MKSPFLDAMKSESVERFIKGGKGSGHFGHAGRDAENLRGGSAPSSGSKVSSVTGNELETKDDLENEKNKLLEKGQGINSAIVNGTELRNGKLIAVKGKLYKVTSTTASDKFIVREATSINTDRLFATGGNDNFLSLDYNAQYLQVNEKEMVNFFKPLPK